MESNGDAKGESKKIEPSVFKPKATIEEQINYFTETRRKEAVPREMKVPEPKTSHDEDEPTP